MASASARYHSRNCAKTYLVIAAALIVHFASFDTVFAKDDANAKAPAQGEVLVDRIVAIVNQQPILYSQVQEKVKIGPLVVVSEYPANEKSASYERALNDAINFELIIQKSKELELDVEDGDVETEIDKLLESRGVSREQLMQYLKEQKKSYKEYKDDSRSFMILRKFQGRVIFPLVKITDKDVETYYLKKSGVSADLLTLSLRQIVIQVSSNMAPNVRDAKRALVEDVHKKLIGGMKFEDAAKIYSDDASAKENGGLMPKLRLKDLSSDLRKSIENLEPGQFSAPIKTSMGYHIFYLEEKAFAENQDFLKQKKNLSVELENIELINQTKKWLSEQRQRSKVTIIKN